MRQSVVKVRGEKYVCQSGYENTVSTTAANSEQRKGGGHASVYLYKLSLIACSAHCKYYVSSTYRYAFCRLKTLFQYPV